MTALLLSLIFSLINSSIELEISAPSFPDIMQHFGVSAAMVGLTLSYNLLGFCLAALFYGPLSDAYGRRRTMLVGNGILCLGGLGCVLAPSMQWLLIARFVQGLGAATSSVVVSAIIADVYRAEKATRLYGIMNAIFTTFMAMAAVAGGFITVAFGWRGPYGVVAIISLISWGVLFFCLPETHLHRTPLHIKKVLQDYRKMLGSALFLVAAAVPSLLYGCYMAFVAIAPFLYMQVFDMSIFLYTLHQAVIIAVYAITSLYAGKISQRYPVVVVIWGALALLVGGILCLLLPSTACVFTTAMSISCIGSAVLYPIIFPKSLEIFPALKGTASSIIMSLRCFLCAGATGVASYCYSGTPMSLAWVLVAMTAVIGAMVVGLVWKMRW